MSAIEKEQISEQLNNVNDGLNVLGNANINKLQEKIFVGVFIPIFAGEESLYNATMETWVRFAGGPYKEVDVIDSKGKVLFRVPPIYDRSTINSTTDGKVPIGHIVTTANQFSRIHPNQGKAYLENELNKKAMLLKVPSNVVKNLEFWNMVFKKYGRNEIMPIDAKEVKVNTSKTNPDDFESF